MSSDLERRAAKTEIRKRTGKLKTPCPPLPAVQGLDIKIRSDAEDPVEDAWLFVTHIETGKKYGPKKTDKHGDVILFFPGRKTLPDGHYEVRAYKEWHLPEPARSARITLPKNTLKVVTLHLEELRYYLCVDGDRDGEIGAADTDVYPRDRNKIIPWAWGANKRGAIVLCNNDHDDGVGDVLKRTLDNADSKINEGNDYLCELAPLQIQRAGTTKAPPTTWKAKLEVLDPHEDKIRVHEMTMNVSTQLLGAADTPDAPPVSSCDYPLIAGTKSRPTKTLWMEATSYPTHPLSAKGFDGLITLRLTISKKNIFRPQQTIRYFTSAVVRVAPWMMPNHTDDSHAVYVVNLGEDYIKDVTTTNASTGDQPVLLGGNKSFRDELEIQVQAAGAGLLPYEARNDVGDRWMQDCMEMGYSVLPKKTSTTARRHRIDAVLQAYRPRGLFGCPRELLDADFGFQESPGFIAGRTGALVGPVRSSNAYQKAYDAALPELKQRVVEQVAHAAACAVEKALKGPSCMNRLRPAMRDAARTDVKALWAQFSVGFLQAVAQAADTAAAGEAGANEQTLNGAYQIQQPENKTLVYKRAYTAAHTTLTAKATEGTLTLNAPVLALSKKKWRRNKLKEAARTIAQAVETAFKSSSDIARICQKMQLDARLATTNLGAPYADFAQEVGQAAADAAEDVAGMDQTTYRDALAVPVPPNGARSTAYQRAYTAAHAEATAKIDSIDADREAVEGVARSAAVAAETALIESGSTKRARSGMQSGATDAVHMEFKCDRALIAEPVGKAAADAAAAEAGNHASTYTKAVAGRPVNSHAYKKAKSAVMKGIRDCQYKAWYSSAQRRVIVADAVATAVVKRLRLSGKAPYSVQKKGEMKTAGIDALKAWAIGVNWDDAANMVAETARDAAITEAGTTALSYSKAIRNTVGGHCPAYDEAYAAGLNKLKDWTDWLEGELNTHQVKVSRDAAKAALKVLQAKGSIAEAQTDMIIEASIAVGNCAEPFSWPGNDYYFGRLAAEAIVQATADGWVGKRANSYDSCGNLECTPPCRATKDAKPIEGIPTGPKDYPWGRIYYGTGAAGKHMLFNRNTREFLEAQRVQAPIGLDTEWLTVGHVDEMMSFIPSAGPRNQQWRLLLASPVRAWKLLNGCPPNTPVLIGRCLSFDEKRETWTEVQTTAGALRGGTVKLSIPKPGSDFMTGADMLTFNKKIQARLDDITRTLIKEIDLDHTRIIEVPVIFRPGETMEVADALTADMVNMLVLDGRCIVPAPFGPRVGMVGGVGGTDVFEKYLTDEIKAANGALDVEFVDDWYTYHALSGEIHCGTNMLRKPADRAAWLSSPAAEWWTFTV